jgi:hypothetical protein
MDDRYLGDPYGAGAMLPPLDTYSRPHPQWNEKMMEIFLGIKIPPKMVQDKKGNWVENPERPKLWLFEIPDVVKHFQLSNLRSRDQTEIERDISDLQMLANQEGNDTLVDELQFRILSKLALFKSRGDLSFPYTERAQYQLNINEMKTGEIKRPTQQSAGFFGELLGHRGGGRGRGGEY